VFRIVLFEPEIPPNTGNVIRLCANTGAELHLVKPLGFDLDKRSLRRAGLDYRWMAAVHVHADLAACREALAAVGTRRWWAVETGVTRRYDEVRYSPGDALLFGSERRGLPPPVIDDLRRAAIAEQGGDVVVEIPMREGNRSLNLSNAVTLVTYEAWRQNGFATVSADAPSGATGEATR